MNGRTTIALPYLLCGILILGICRPSDAQSVDTVRTRSFPSVRTAVPLPPPPRVWIFVMAGQSNMAGRALVEPQDTIPHPRLRAVDAHGDVVEAKEPLHWYEPSRTGLDCGVSFGRTLLPMVPDSITILLLPTAIGGSSLQQWLSDSLHRGVRLMTNLRERLQSAARFGTVRGILWHQGEADANDADAPFYAERLGRLFRAFRSAAGDEHLPIVIGELGSYLAPAVRWQQVNEQLRRYAAADTLVRIVPTGDLLHKGDGVHFDSEGQRTLGERYARGWSSVGTRR